MRVILELFKKYKEAILYIIFGGFTFLTNLITYVVCTRLFNIDILISNTIAWIVSVVFAYITNKIFVFESKETKLSYVIKEFSSFVGCRIFSGVVELVIIFLMATLAGINDLIVKIVTNVVVIILNYVCSKLIIFKKKDESKYECKIV